MKNQGSKSKKNIRRARAIARLEAQTKAAGYREDVIKRLQAQILATQSNMTGVN